MKKVIIDEAKPYQAPKHFNMVALRLHHKDTTGTKKFWVGLSHFLPGGGAEWDKSDTEKVYFVLSGKITVKSEKGEKFVLGPMESLYIPPGESRFIINETNFPATMLVIISYD